jgi:hypothetical protein
MIPLRDNIPSRTTPFVNYTMIGLCAVVFFFQLSDRKGALVERYGMIPARVADPGKPIEIPDRRRVKTARGIEIHTVMHPAEASAVPSWLTLLTCIFLHGGWMHFLGNMLFLHIFGDNVEDRFGHLGYLLFYTGCGVAASAAHLVSAPDSVIPTIGASGAIAGVMGAYLLLYPHARVMTLIPIVFFMSIVVIPAPMFLVVWFLMQLFQGTASITATVSTGVAWWAHIGGFAAGFAVAWLLRQSHHLRPPVTARLPHSGRFEHHRYRRGDRPWG